jgi:hypothetical protein
MAVAATKTQPADAPPPVLSLEERYTRAYNEMVALGEELLAQRLAYLKACYPSLPLPTLEMDLRKHRTCSCAVVLEILAAKEKEGS